MSDELQTVNDLLQELDGNRVNTMQVNRIGKINAKTSRSQWKRKSNGNSNNKKDDTQKLFFGFHGVYQDVSRKKIGEYFKSLRRERKK